MTYPYQTHTTDYTRDLAARERDARELDQPPEAVHFGYEHMTAEQRVNYSRWHADANDWGTIGSIIHGAQSNLLRFANMSETTDEAAKAARQAAVALAAMKEPYFAKHDELRERANQLTGGKRS